LKLIKNENLSRKRRGSDETNYYTEDNKKQSELLLATHGLNYAMNQMKIFSNCAKQYVMS